MPQNVNGILGRLNRPKRNPEFNKSLPTSPDNLRYTEPGAFKRLLGNNADELNNAEIVGREAETRAENTKHSDLQRATDAAATVVQAANLHDIEEDWLNDRQAQAAASRKFTTDSMAALNADLTNKAAAELNVKNDQTAYLQTLADKKEAAVLLDTQRGPLRRSYMDLNKERAKALKEETDTGIARTARTAQNREAERIKGEQPGWFSRLFGSPSKPAEPSIPSQQPPKIIKMEQPGRSILDDDVTSELEDY